MENMKDYTIWEWFKRLVSGHPHIRIFPGEYIDRWHLIPRNNRFNIYLHKYYGGDVSRVPHDHPWWNCTIVLRGRLFESRYTREIDDTLWPKVYTLNPLSVVTRTAETIHHIEMLPEDKGKTWTLFITGPKTRKWGFWEDDGATFVPWEEYEEKTGLQDYGGKQKS